MEQNTANFKIDPHWGSRNSPIDPYVLLTHNWGACNTLSLILKLSVLESSWVIQTWKQLAPIVPKALWKCSRYLCAFRWHVLSILVIQMIHFSLFKKSTVRALLKCFYARKFTQSWHQCRRLLLADLQNINKTTSSRIICGMQASINRFSCCN